ncbi:MAG TPA: CvpA family protein [Myxococcota bacterium]|nr:CvpA family protein [Myxococcota bacterium]
MSVDLLSLLILVAYIAIGAWRGALASALGIFTLIAAYGLSLLAGAKLGDAAAARLSVAPLLGTVLVGAIAFTAAMVVLGIASRMLLAHERRGLGDEPLSALERLGGALLGGLRGAVVVLLVGWLTAWVDGVATAVPESMLPRLGPSHVGQLAERAVEAGAGAALDQQSPGGRITVQLLAHPGESIEGLKGALANGRLEALRDDSAFWEALEGGDLQAALARGSFRSLPYDPELRHDFAQMGLVARSAADSPPAFEQAIVDATRQVAPRLAGIRSDPQFQSLLQDPKVLDALQRGDRWALLSDPRFQLLAVRLGSGG